MGAHAVSLGDRLLRPRRTRELVHRLADGLTTTVHVATWPRRTTRVRVEALDPPQPLRAYARRSSASDLLVGGFHVDSTTTPLGEIWTDGLAHMSVPFDEPWDAARACIAIDGDEVELAPRGMLPARPRGDLLQAGPLLVTNGRPLLAERPGVPAIEGTAGRSRDPEGFAAGAHQFDADLTDGRHPRAAFGLTRDRFIAAVCDGRSMRDAGMTLPELAALMAELGAEAAINLAGGGSASLVCAGRLQNRPRDEHGVPLLGGRPVASALVFGR
jgi:hypothetical protein